MAAGSASVLRGKLLLCSAALLPDEAAGDAEFGSDSCSAMAWSVLYGQDALLYGCGQVLYAIAAVKLLNDHSLIDFLQSIKAIMTIFTACV
jgi:hypothetical protein